MNGNQAIARGFYEAGGLVATSYPGSPTVEIIQDLRNHHKGIYSEFSVNEKVALEVAIGASFAGVRSMVAMKHVGLNIAADPFMTFTQTKVNGGFLLVTGDDPGMSSSQNEQDNRLLGKFAHIPIFDPSDSLEAKEFTKKAFVMSETFNTPVMMRITSRLCHSRSIVEFEEPQEKIGKEFVHDLKNFGMIPPNTFEKQFVMKERLERIAVLNGEDEFNRFEESDDKSVLIITSGLMYNNLKELGLDISIYKLGLIYPLPIERMRRLADEYKRVIVIEELMPFIEDELKINNIDCEGKKYFSFTGELGSDLIEKGLIEAGIIKKEPKNELTEETIVNRLSMFCSGCPHRPVFDILKKSKVDVIGDIGCYSLALMPPLEILNSVISMGASIGIMKGMSKAYTLSGIDKPLVAVIGDGTFYHSGMTSLLNLQHQMDKDFNMTLLILNNGVTAMTGGQFNASSGHYTPNSDMNVNMLDLIKSFGFEHVREVDQFDYNDAKKIINEELKYKGLSIIITTRPCALNFKIVDKPFYVDPNVCIACRTCVKTNCPPIAMKEYEGIGLKSSINKDMCVGCSICSQVCPVGAIKLIGGDKND